MNKRKIRAKSSVETIWWLCKNPELCKADVRNVLVPYSERTKRMMEHPEKFFKNEQNPRPSGHIMNRKSWAQDNGGAIPSNLLQVANTDSNSQYLRYCRGHGIKPHPSRFPAGLVEFFVKFLTEEGDLVVDPFAGSNTTGMVAERFGRRWMAFELEEEYINASASRVGMKIKNRRQ